MDDTATPKATLAKASQVAMAKPTAAPQRKTKPVVKTATTTLLAPVRAISSAPTRAISAAKDISMDTITTATDKTQAMFADVNTRAKGAMEKGQKMFDEMNEFNKGNIEALVESSKIAVRAIETIGQDAAAYARKSFEEASAAAKTLASVKSPTEFMKLQGDYMRSAFDAMVAQSSRSTETMLKLAGEVAQPISNRAAIAADKMKIAA